MQPNFLIELLEERPMLLNGAQVIRGTRPSRSSILLHRDELLETFRSPFRASTGPRKEQANVADDPTDHAYCDRQGVARA